MATDKRVTKQLQSSSDDGDGRPSISRNKHGLGTVYRRGKTWWIKFYFRNQPHYESARSQNHADAVRLLKRRLAETGRGVQPGAQAERLTLKEVGNILFDDYAANQRKTLKDARRAFGEVSDFFGPAARAVDITADRLNAFVKHRRDGGAAASTIRNELAALKRGLNLAMRAGLLASRPIFPTVEVRNTRTGFFEQHEFDAVYLHLPDYVRPVAKFLYLTGWRSGEVLPLKWSQVSFAAGVVRLEPGTTKNDEGRVLPFAALPPLAELMKEQRDRTDAVEKATQRIVPCVFHRQGEPFSSFRKSWKRACAAAGVERIPHDFRRTAVRNLERAGVPRSVAMKLTGHKTESVYRRYAIVSEADLAEGMAKLSRLHQSLAERNPDLSGGASVLTGKGPRRRGHSGARAGRRPAKGKAEHALG